MRTLFISRHPGAAAWAELQGLQIDCRIVHFVPALISRDDTVAGTLSVHLAADVCARGARHLHLTLDLSAHARGRELTADELERFGVRLEHFIVARELCASGRVKFIDAAATTCFRSPAGRWISTISLPALRRTRCSGKAMRRENRLTHRQNQ